MAGLRGWLGLGNDEDEDDPVKKTLDYLGSFGTAAADAASDTVGAATAAIGAAGSGLGSSLSSAASGVTSTLGEAAQAGWEGLSPTGAPRRTAPTWEDPLAPVRESIEYIGQSPGQFVPALAYGRAQGAAADPIGRRAGEAAGLSAEPTMTIPESVPFVGGTPFSQQDVAGQAAQLTLDPLNFVGVPAAVKGGQSVAGAVARALPGVGELEALGRGGAGLVRRGASAVGASAVGEHLAENAGRVAAADARIAEQGATAVDPLYGSTLIVPPGSPVRAKVPSGGAPFDLLPEEQEPFVGAAKAVAGGGMAPGSAEHLDPSHPVEWHDLQVKINNKGQYDGVHDVTLPFFRNAAGEMVPLEPPNVGPMGSPVNSAYSKAVAGAGGRNGYLYGRFRSADGRLHTFDSPQEVVFMHDLDNQVARGEIDAWWPGETAPQRTLAEAPYYSTNRDKGGVKTYNPDFIVRRNDGSLEVIEAKPGKVIAEQEEYGVKAGAVSGHMGWSVATKAAGIIAGLAEQGATYRLLLPEDARGMVPRGPSIGTGRGTTSQRPDLIPGVDIRDQGRLASKTIGAEGTAGGIGREIADVMAATSRKALAEAERLKALGVDSAERLERLTRLVRDDLLATAARRTKGAGEGQMRAMQVAGSADLPTYYQGPRGPLSLDDLAEFSPDHAAELAELDRFGARLGPLSVHDVALPDGTTVPRLTFSGSGDPQASIRAAAKMRELGMGGGGVWYHDTKGPYRVGQVALPSPGGDFEAIRRAVTEGADGAPILHPVYNSEHELAGIDVLGRAADGAAVPERILDATADRLSRALADAGLTSTYRGLHAAEFTHFAGEVGHAATPAEAVTRTGYLLGLEPVPRTERPVRAVQRRGAGGGRPSTGGAGEAAPEAPGAAALGDVGGSPDLDDLGDLETPAQTRERLLAGVTLLAPPGSVRGLDRLASVNRAISEPLLGAASGAYLGAGAPAESDEERRQHALAGAGLGLVGGPLLSRGIGAVQRRAGAGAGTRGARASLGAVPGGIDPDEVADLARRVAETPMTRPRTDGEHVVRNVARQVQKQAARGVTPDVPTAAMPPPDAPPGWGDKYNTYRYSIGMFSNISTGLVQLLGGAVDAALGIPTEMIRTGVMKGRPELLPAMAREAVASVPGMARAAGRTIKGDIPEEILKGSEYRPPLSKQYAERGEAANAAIANAAELPGRAMTMAPDAFWNEGFYKAGLAQAAADEAAATVGRTDPLGAMRRQNELIGNPTPEVEARARQLAEDATYKGDLGFWAGLPQQLFHYPESAPLGKSGAARVARGIGGHLMPVYKTIARIHERALEVTPGVGLLPLNRMGLAHPTRTRALDQKLAQQAVGLAVGLGVWNYAASGGVRGPGPSDSNELQAMMDQGYVPNTFNVGGYWVPISYLGMWGPYVQGIAAVNDAILYDVSGKRFADLSTEDKMNRIVSGIGKGFRDYPFADATSSIMRLGQDPSASFAGLIGETASQLVPAPLRTLAAAGDPTGMLVAPDPWERRPDRGDDIGALQRGVDTFKQRSGIGRQSLPIKQDILGRPVPNRRQGASAYIPRVGADREDPIIQAFLDADVNIGDPPKRLSIEGLKDSDNAPALTSAEQRRWNELRGEILIGIVQPMLDAGTLAGAVPEARTKVLERARTQAGEAAHRRLRAELGDEVTRRLTENRSRRAS